MGTMVHVKCGFCGKDFEVSQEKINELAHGQPIWHDLGYVDEMVGINILVRPHQQDICQQCASRGAFFAASQMREYLHKPSDFVHPQQQAHEPKRSWFYWFSWVVVTAAFAVLMLLALIGM